MKKFILVPTPDGADQLIKVSQISRVIQKDQDYDIIMKGGRHADVTIISISPAEVLALIQGERLDPQRSAERKAKQMRADMAEDLEEPKEPKEPKLSRRGFNLFVERYRVLAGKEDLTLAAPGNATAEKMSAWLYCVLTFCTDFTEWGSDLRLTAEAAARGHFVNATIYTDHVMLRRYDGKLIRLDVKWSKYQEENICGGSHTQKI